MSLVDDILAKEARSMGRSVKLIEAHEFADDTASAIVVFYECEGEPERTIGGKRHIQKRIVVDTAESKASIIVQSYFK